MTLKRANASSGGLLGRRAISGLTALSLGAGAIALTVAGATVTAAALQDDARLNVTAVGFDGVFDVGVVTPEGTVEQADGDAPYLYPFPAGATLLPGGSVTAEIPVFNNTNGLAAATDFQVQLLNEDGRVDAATPNITPFIRFSAVNPAGELIFENVTWDQAKGSLGVLSSRGAEPLSPGASFTEGADGSKGVLALTVSYLDADGVRELNGGQSAFAIRFDASSVKS
ncbi:hypothetical protein [Leucobacter chromiiresistens]|uniref:Uncharacterized protein n=1 Tax=Leucobacter chromiiresistens TaxID=1079994 RepID=A0A1H1BD78_9MICO|nr:hypothetical protein [Leucobacter chromiiresistens]SDQ49948.1 hypothetical protein SAMN04488565_2750 [Leucobacter chromiiresistens]